MIIQETQSPLVWLVSSGFVQSSEVWMYRQAMGMKRLHLKVMTAHRHNEKQFPTSGLDIEVVDHPTPFYRNPITRNVYLYSCQAANYEHGWYRGAPSEAKWFAERLKRERPLAALCHFGMTAVQMLPLLKEYDVPVIPHFNGCDLTSALRGINYRRTLLRALPRFEKCVVVADYQRQWLLKHGVQPDRIEHIPYGFPIKEFSQANLLGEAECRFLAVGRLVDKKRPDLTLRAFGMCAESCSNIKLIMIGDGPLESKCRAIVDELGIADRVELMGAQPFDEVKRQMSLASAFVQHSVTAQSGDKEGWPVAIGEAAGSGLPVIATRHASIPEQVEHGVTGLLCDEHDWQTMGQHMIELANQPELRVKMGQAAREKLSAFTTAGQVHKLEDVLLQVANSQATLVK